MMVEPSAGEMKTGTDIVGFQIGQFRHDLLGGEATGK